MYLTESAALAAIAQKTRSEQWGKRRRWFYCASFGAGDAVRTRRDRCQNVRLHDSCQSILDIGMFTGYSALAMAEALPADGLSCLRGRRSICCRLCPSFVPKFPTWLKIHVELGSAWTPYAGLLTQARVIRLGVY